MSFKVADRWSELATGIAALGFRSEVLHNSRGDELLLFEEDAVLPRFRICHAHEMREYTDDAYEIIENKPKTKLLIKFVTKKDYVKSADIIPVLEQYLETGKRVPGIGFMQRGF